MSLMPTRNEAICVIGLGYIGLPTAALLASRGFRVLGVDTNPQVVETISRGDVHIAEPDLDGLVQKAVSSGALTVAETPEPANTFIITVPTPLTAENEPDVTSVEAAARNVANVLEAGNLIIIESTVPVGTSETIAELLSELRPDLGFPVGGEDAPDVAIAYCPERVLPGRIITELIQNDRCIGGLTPACSKRACMLYQSFLEGECFETTARTAELVKLTENAFRDVNIALANELSMIADQLDINVWDLITLANKHPRVNILQPGPGVGGHCIAIDPWFIVHSAPEQARLIRSAREINQAKPDHVVAKVDEAMAEKPNARIACLGLTFKPNVDDMRNSPALTVAERLVEKYGERVLAVEPFASSLPDSLVAAQIRHTDALTAVDAADIILLLVDHRQFRMIDVKQLGDKVIIDTRGLWHPRPA